MLQLDSRTLFNTIKRDYINSDRESWSVAITVKNFTLFAARQTVQIWLKCRETRGVYLVTLNLSAQYYTNSFILKYGGTLGRPTRVQFEMPCVKTFWTFSSWKTKFNGKNLTDQFTLSSTKFNIRFNWDFVIVVYKVAHWNRHWTNNEAKNCFQSFKLWILSAMKSNSIHAVSETIKISPVEQW